MRPCYDDHTTHLEHEEELGEDVSYIPGHDCIDRSIRCRRRQGEAKLSPDIDNQRLRGVPKKKNQMRWSPTLWSMPVVSTPATLCVLKAYTKSCALEEVGLIVKQAVVRA
jgi:hypothetical protein